MHGGHHLCCAFAAGGAGEHRPGLGVHEDFALVAFLRTELEPVEAVGAEIPVAVPGVLLEIRVELGEAFAGPGGFFGLIEHARDGGVFAKGIP